MMAFPSMLVSAALKAGIKVPANPNKFDKDEFPHFTVFLITNCCVPMPYAGSHWDNAKIIAEIPESEIRTQTLTNLIAKGLHIKT